MNPEESFGSYLQLASRNEHNSCVQVFCISRELGKFDRRADHDGMLENWFGVAIQRANAYKISCVH
jgi:hypothetical protein